MKARALILTLALSFAGAAAAFAQSPQMGTWKMDEAKSKIPAEAAKNTTVVYEAQGDSVKVTTDGTMNGQPVHTEWTGKFDGKDYPVTGETDADTRAYTKVNDHTLTLTAKKGGKVTSSGRIVVSPDGKTRNLTLHSTTPDGKQVTTNGVYEKQ